MAKPKLSIGFPAYNAERFMSHSLDSILGQSFGDFELIISDNASTDSTADICRWYASKDRRIRYSRNSRNLGASANFSMVFELASCEYFKWISYDDVCGPGFLEKCVDVLDNDSSVVLAYPRTTLIDEHGEKIRDFHEDLHLQDERPHLRLNKFLNRINFANSVFGVMRSEVLRKTRLLGAFFGADYILLMEMCLRGKFHEIPERLFFYREHDRNSRKLPRQDLTLWWDTSYRGVMNNTQRRLVAEQFKSIARSELPWTEKLLCYLQIRRWIIRYWRAKGGRYKAKIKKRLRLVVERG